MDIDITYLYNTGEISGALYLKCIESDINTLQEAIEKGILAREDFDALIEPDGLIMGEGDDAPSFDFESLRETIVASMNSMSVRAFHAMNAILQSSCDLKEFLQTITSEDFHVEKLHAVGRKTIPEINSFIDEMKGLTEHCLPPKVTTTVENNSSEVDQQLLPYFNTLVSGASTRTRNILIAALDACQSSVWSLYTLIHEPGFRVKDWKNAGRKSEKEIKRILELLSKAIEDYRSGILGDSIQREINGHALKSSGVSAGTDEISRLADELGYFPYFKAVDAFIDNLPDKHRTILSLTISIYNDVQLDTSRKDVGTQVGLTAERVRQLRNKILTDILTYAKSLIKHQQKGTSLWPSHCYAATEIRTINTAEQTHFSDNFVLWMLSIIAPEKYSLLGNIEDAMYSPYGNARVVNLVPTDLTKIFDFKRFYRDFENISLSKRVDDQELELSDIVRKYFKDKIYYEKVEELEDVCKGIMLRSFDFKVLGRTVYIHKNAERNNPELVEIIIRDAGRPLTIEEIYTEFEKRYPGKTKSQVALSGAVRTNNNIRPVGRSSTFTLKEWSSGQERGGTIREFAEEYLLTLPEPVAKLEDIGKYVRQFRPTSSDKSIHANLMLDGAGNYSVFIKDGGRYIGLTNFNYQSGFKRLDPGNGAKRDFRVSCTLLETFVAENGRLPFSNNVPEEEKRLNRFWKVQLSKLSKGDLQPEEAAIIESMKGRFESLKVSKKDFEWFQKYGVIKNAFSNGFPISSLSQTLQDWYLYQTRGLKYGYIPEDKKPYITELIELSAKYVK